MRWYEVIFDYPHEVIGETPRGWSLRCARVVVRDSGRHNMVRETLLLQQR